MDVRGQLVRRSGWHLGRTEGVSGGTGGGFSSKLPRGIPSRAKGVREYVGACIKN